MNQYSWSNCLVIIWLFIGLFCWDGNALLHRIGIIGGGPSGLMSAIRCAELLKQHKIQNEITIFENNQEPLSKILISGGGRCNLMHDPNKAIKSIVKAYPRGYREVLGPYTSVFGPQETYDWFKERGLSMKIEKDGRVFPTSNQASDVKELLLQEAKKYQIQIKCQERLINLHKTSENAYSIELESTPSLTFDSIVLATGSSRRGFDILKQLGHSINRPIPSLFSFVVKNNEDLSSLSGLSNFYTKSQILLPSNTTDIKNQLSTIYQERFKSLLPTLTQRGPLLFTQEGFSGPNILKLSSYAARILQILKYKFELEISWLGEITDHELFEIFQKIKLLTPNRKLSTGFPKLSPELYLDMERKVTGHRNLLTIHENEASDDGIQGYHPKKARKDLIHDEDLLTFVSRRLWQYLLIKANISPDITWSQIDFVSLHRLIEQLLHSKFSIDGKSLFKEEFVTCGGLPLNEIYFNKMESKLHPRLYFAGELLDVDGITGGFNFQFAWTSGYVAGSHCAQSCLNLEQIMNR